jgi:hypothetical protein
LGHGFEYRASRLVRQHETYPVIVVDEIGPVALALVEVAAVVDDRFGVERYPLVGGRLPIIDEEVMSATEKRILAESPTDLGPASRDVPNL